MSAEARELPQRMAAPTDGTELCLKRAAQYLASHPRGVLMPRRLVGEPQRIWTDTDWDGRHIQRNGGTICECGAIVG